MSAYFTNGSLTWTDTVYNIPPNEQPSVTVLSEKRAALHLPGFCLDGRGFALHLHIDHLETLKTLVQTLEALQAGTYQEKEPF